MEDKILNVTEWYTTDQIPTASQPLFKELLEEYGTYTGTQDPSGNVLAGCYQWAHKDDIENIDNIIHADIGYTGVAGRNIIDRVRAVVVPSGRHPVKMALRQRNWSLEDVRVRYLITESGDQHKLEKDIHDKTKKNFGERYKWTDAELSNDNKHVYVEDTFRQLTYPQAKQVLPKLIEITKELGKEYVDIEIDKIVNGE